MSNNRSIERIINAPAPSMVGDGFRVHSFFNREMGLDKYRMSPFFMMDYNAKIEFSPRNHPRGVGAHPHRGFETVTLAYAGRIAHRDSAGNSGVIGEGDVQWMTAASGVMHEEFHEEEFSRTGGPFQMVQLWVNLPAKDKMAAPKYQELKNAQLGKYQLENNLGYVEVVAGEYQNVKGPASTFTPMHVYNLHLKKGAKLKLSFPATNNTGILQMEGENIFNGTQTDANNFVLFANDGESIEVQALQDGMALVLSGAPINEPIAQYGPFLMNTWEELEQAISDVAAGKFGVIK